jgi:hypothetical protein
MTLPRQGMTDALVGSYSGGLAPGRSPDRQVIRLAQQWPELLKGRIAWIEHAEPRLCSIVGMRHDPVQRGKIVGADINFAGAEQHLECLLTHADVQAE